MASPLIHENVWFEKPKYEAAERQYYERLAKLRDCQEEEDKVCFMASQINTVNPPAETSPSSAASVKDEKRSKKEKKNKNKEKKRDALKDQSLDKLTNGNPPLVSKSSAVDGSAGGTIKTLKNKSNGILSEEKKVNASASCVTQGLLPYKGVPEDVGNTAKKSQCYSSATVKGSFMVPKRLDHHGVNSVDIQSKVSNIHFGDRLYEEKGSDIWKTDQRRMFEKASSNSPQKQSLASEVAKARQHIKQSLECMDDIAAMAGNNVDLVNRINGLEKENTNLHKVVADLKNLVITLDQRVKSLEGGKSTSAPTAKPVKKQEEDDDDGVDLFGSDSDEESEEAAKVREARLKAYSEKKSKKPALIAKSNIILSVSPWDDETDMKKMEECVRSIEMDGLIWGASKLVPLAYGIHKLHISCVVEDDKVSIDLLQEKIQEFEDYVQSADIAAFNKV